MNVSDFLPILLTIGGICVMTILFIVPFILFFVWLARSNKKSSEKVAAARQLAQRWPSTTGRVITSRAEVHGGRDSTYVLPRVVFMYTVGAVEYKGERIMFEDKFFHTYSSGEAYDMVDKYPVGADVTVYYNPANPAEATLER